jgi:hypothetical protein
VIASPLPLFAALPQPPPVSARDRVADLFRSRPNQWISATEIELYGGRYAWRTECSRCHTELGMLITKRLDYEGGKVVRSWRRYEP